MQTELLVQQSPLHTPDLLGIAQGITITPEGVIAGAAFAALFAATLITAVRGYKGIRNYVKGNTPRTPTPPLM